MSNQSSTPAASTPRAAAAPESRGNSPSERRWRRSNPDAYVRTLTEDGHTYYPTAAALNGVDVLDQALRTMRAIDGLRRIAVVFAADNSVGWSWSRGEL